jgi:hypothetical protein
MARIAKLVSDPSLLEAALEGLEAQRYRIEDQIQQVRRLLGKRSTNGTHQSAAPAAKRQLSPAARRRIAAAQKKRWAAYRKSAAEK